MWTAQKLWEQWYNADFIFYIHFIPTVETYRKWILEERQGRSPVKSSDFKCKWTEVKGKYITKKLE